MRSFLIEKSNENTESKSLEELFNIQNNVIKYKDLEITTSQPREIFIKIMKNLEILSQKKKRTIIPKENINYIKKPKKESYNKKVVELSQSSYNGLNVGDFVTPIETIHTKECMITTKDYFQIESIIGNDLLLKGKSYRFPIELFEKLNKYNLEKGDDVIILIYNEKCKVTSVSESNNLVIVVNNQYKEIKCKFQEIIPNISINEINDSI